MTSPRKRSCQQTAVHLAKRSNAGNAGNALHDADSMACARAAGLTYLSDDTPGIRRIRSGKAFQYVYPNGHTVHKAADLARIRSLAIPPAWEKVWISPRPNGHLQATGLDSRGRKQYRYHSRWRQVRDELKYYRTLLFGETLPRIRRAVDRDLVRAGLPREKVVAAVVRLLERTLIRVGNEEYVRQNGSFGLTTFLDRHARIVGQRVEFQFRGKGGVRHQVELRDRRLAAVVRKCRDVPGQELFQYLDEQGQRHSIGSADVNEYLHRIAGSGFTAKDFRTWAGTVLALRAFQEIEAAGSKARAKKNIVRAMTAVAKCLGNTTAVCRKCYVHPAIIEAYVDGSLGSLRAHSRSGTRGAPRELGPEEAALLGFLRKRFRTVGLPPRVRRPDHQRSA